MPAAATVMTVPMRTVRPGAVAFAGLVFFAVMTVAAAAMPLLAVTMGAVRPGAVALAGLMLLIAVFAASALVIFFGRRRVCSLIAFKEDFAQNGLPPQRHDMLLMKFIVPNYHQIIITGKQKDKAVSLFDFFPSAQRILRSKSFQSFASTSSDYRPTQPTATPPPTQQQLLAPDRAG
jgi:hypothetical protein